MQATTRPILLQPGQALAPDRHASGWLVVAEGEVLVQAPARWLGETLVLAPPRRVAAPAAIACSEVASLAALGTAKVHLEEAAGVFGRLRAAWTQWRPAWGWRQLDRARSG
jgi:hypothetical protein